MYQLRSLIANLEKELKKLDIIESIELRISNIPNFDFQINNLVKFKSLTLFLNITTNKFMKSINIGIEII
mgnify:CR=1 FL=1